MPEAALSAVVQRDAVGQLPAGVAPISRPVSSGVVRTVFGALPESSSDLFHGLDVDLPLATCALTVATVHDTSVIDMPSASSWFRAKGEQQLLRRALRKADVLLAVSEFTAERIQAISGRHALVVELAPAAWARPPSVADVLSVRKKYCLPALFVLQVGTVEPRKNVALVAEVAELLGLPYLLAGAGSTGLSAPRTAVGLGYVDTADLPALYAAATITAYASKYEGYGLPPLEAMACGGAVVASAVGALPQVVGDGAVLVGPDRVAEWVDAMRPLAFDADARAALVSAALTVAGTLTWRRTAERTVRAYREAGAAV
ncbi:MAG: mshA 3 [Mycobacterium sp.]|jgi:glycosyltransferase involved in cell wall biosynthesis|nr:mshA 3 [Mycobacterium sp.]